MDEMVTFWLILKLAAVEKISEHEFGMEQLKSMN